MKFQVLASPPGVPDRLMVTTGFTHNTIFYKAALAETVSWEGQLTGTWDVLLQSRRGTQRLTLVKGEEGWRAGEEIEQIGVIEQEVVDLLGEVIREVAKQDELA